MAHELLDGGEIRAGVEEITPERASQVVRRERCYAGLLSTPFDGPIQARARQAGHPKASATGYKVMASTGQWLLSDGAESVLTDYDRALLIRCEEGEPAEVAPTQAMH